MKSGVFDAMSESEQAVVRHISRATIRPSQHLEETRCNLTPWDLRMLTIHYNQTGIFLPKPSQHQQLIDHMKLTLSHTLVHFYPLAGRLCTHHHLDGTVTIFINCNSAGAEFIHATSHITMANLLHPLHAPQLFKSLFPLNGALNHGGHNLPLLVVQVTELADGMFIGCSMNHCLADGTSFWHFISAWSEISRDGLEHISRPPIIDRWFPNNHSSIHLHLSGDEFTERYTPPSLTERVFHFTSEAVARLKSKANEECHNTAQISSFQALSAHVWRSVTKAQGLPAEEKTSCRFYMNTRKRLEPRLSADCFGNYVHPIGATTTVGELLGQGLGWAALLVFEAVVAESDKTLRGWMEGWIKKPSFYRFSSFDGSSGVVIASSPWFDVYGNDFGWGKPVAVRSGPANKVDGKITLFPGREGGGSIDLELCLSNMEALESDQKFMEAFL